jgi:hypothetical protein
MVWSDRTIVKLEQPNLNGMLKQMKLVCAMFEMMYFLMMNARDAISDGNPFLQFIAPVKK